MELEEIFEKIKSGRAVLITGSGAHRNAIGANGEKLPTGPELSKRLYSECGIMNPDDPKDLQDSSETYLEMHSPSELVEFLKTNLYVKKITKAQKELYKIQWQRVYTTNYDEIPRIATASDERTYKPITLDMEYNPKLMSERLCVYLNGYLNNLTDDKVTKELKLTGKSYLVSDYIENSQWGAIFNSDIESSACVIIVGLSLEYDLDIKRFIYNAQIRNKTYFVNRVDISDDNRRKLSRYGTVLPFGIEEFTQQYSEYVIKNPFVPTEVFIYRSFERFSQNYSLSTATTAEVYSFFLNGNYEKSPNIWYKKSGKYLNVVGRTQIDLAVKLLSGGVKVLYVHASLGNGKTIFIEELKQILQGLGYKIFTLQNELPNCIHEEIRQIAKENGKRLVVIENYFNFTKVIEEFGHYDISDIQFVFSARSALRNIRIIDVSNFLRLKDGEAQFINLNKLDGSEIASLRMIFERNGLWGRLSGKKAKQYAELKASNKGNKEFQSILINSIHAESMKKRFRQTINNIKQMSGGYYNALVLALLVKTMSLNISATDVGRIIGINIAMEAAFVNNSDVKEVLDFGSGKAEFNIKSAVTAKFILQELDCDDAILNVLANVAKYANHYYKIEQYNSVLRNIISYSHVKTILGIGNKESFLLRYYDSLKNLEYYKQNSFYWLQYSIACTNVKRYDLAQMFIDNAYEYFRATETVVPFQIDTQQSILYMLIVEENASDDIAKSFEKAHRLLMEPTVSIKDDPAKQIKVFKFYVRKSVAQNMEAVGAGHEYHRYCAEAYGKVQRYNRTNAEDWSKKLETQLMKASIINGEGNNI